MLLPVLLLLFSCSSSSKKLNAQSYVQKSIKDFGAKGDGKTNDHLAFTKAAKFFNDRKGNGKLIISAGTYLLGRQNAKADGKGYVGEDILSLAYCSSMTIEGQGKVLLKMKEKLKIGSFDPSTGKAFVSAAAVFADQKFMASPGNFILLRNCKNILIKNISMDGSNRTMETGGKYGDVGFQVPACGLYAVDVYKLGVENVNVRYCGLDGIMVMNKTPDGVNTANQLISLKNCKFEYNARQGFSWTGGVGLTADDCEFSHTGRANFVTSPGAGLDIEAETGIITGGKFNNCRFVNNSGVGMVADSGPSQNCEFTNCTFWGVTQWSMWSSKPGFKFRDCNFYGSIAHGYDANTKAEATEFINCIFEDKPYNGKDVYGRYLIEINAKRRMLFDKCTFTARSRRLIWFEGKNNLKDEEMPYFKNCTFNVYDIPHRKPDFFTKMHGVIVENAVSNFYIKDKDVSQFIPAYGINKSIGTSKVKIINPAH